MNAGANATVTPLDSPWMLSATSLVKRYGDFVAVDCVSIAVRPGEVFGLLGPNGAGKTTTVGMCTGLLRPTSGSVTIGGVNLARDAAGAKRQIGYVPDNPYLYDRLTGREFVRFMGRLYAATQNLEQRVDRLLSFFDLQTAADDLIGGYSRGMKQKTALCGAIIHDPKLLFLDEPTVGLDPKSARILKDTVLELAAQGCAVVFCTHILEIAQAVCDRVAILDHGKVVAQGTLAELRGRRDPVSAESLEDIFLRLTGEDDQRSIAEALLGI